MSKKKGLRKRPRKTRMLCIGCGKPASGRMVRGLHQYCRRIQTEAQSRGEVTEDQLERAGKLLPRKKTGPNPNNHPMTRQLMKFAAGQKTVQPKTCKARSRMMRPARTGQ